MYPAITPRSHHNRPWPDVGVMLNWAQHQYWRRNLGHPVAWQPKFDIRDIGDAYELFGELPGMKKEDLNIELAESRTLLISGKVEASFASSTGGEPKTTQDKHDSSRDTRDDTKEHDENEKPNYWLQERHIGEFSRVFNFPAGFEKPQLSATMARGVLRMILPNPSGSKSYRIPIN